jgi:hypothetical protein
VAHDLQVRARSTALAILLESPLPLRQPNEPKRARIRAGVDVDGQAVAVACRQPEKQEKTVNLGAMAAAVVLQTYGERDNGRVVKVNVQSGLSRWATVRCRQVMENLIECRNFTVNTAGAEIWMGFCRRQCRHENVLSVTGPV